MGHVGCSGSFLAVCLLIFSPSLLADGVHSFTDHVDSFFDSSTNDADGNSASVGDHSAFSDSRTLGSDKDDLNWLGDFDDDHGKAWGPRKHLHHHYYGVSGENFGDQDYDNEDTDGNTGNWGSAGIGDTSTTGIPEPSVLVLLSTALAAFFLKSLRRAMV